MQTAQKTNIPAALIEIAEILEASATALARSSWTHNQAIDIHIAAKRLTTIAYALAAQPIRRPAPKVAP